MKPQWRGEALKTYLQNGFRIVESAVADIGGGLVMNDCLVTKDLASEAVPAA